MFFFNSYILNAVDWRREIFNIANEKEIKTTNSGKQHKYFTSITRYSGIVRINLYLKMQGQAPLEVSLPYKVVHFDKRRKC